MKGLASYLFVACMTLPWVVLRFTRYAGEHAYHEHALAVAILAGIAILGSALLLSWAGEVAQLDISQALALAFLAFIAVLPEYSVDMYFSWKAGKDPAYNDYPVANMTGANRLLIGIGWPSVLLVHGLRRRVSSMELGQDRAIELRYLLMATLYSFTLPIKGTLSWIDAVVFVALFVFYMRAASGASHVEPELLGPAKAMASLGTGARRVAVVASFLFAGIVIFLSAEPFAEALVASGETFGVDKFLLVQWVAPLASESPEFLVALMFAWKGFAGAGLGTLVSSKVNQWTLLVGLIPIVYAISAGGLVPLVLSAQQRDELLLTSAQSAFAIAVMSDLAMNWWEALLLVGLFASQFLFSGTTAHHWIAILYIALTLLLLLASKEKRTSMIGLLSRRKIGEGPIGKDSGHQA